MHQNLLNAGFASVWYFYVNNENVQKIQVIKPQRYCSSAFAAHMPAINCIFGLKFDNEIFMS
jgi:hypothetical protein